MVAAVLFSVLALLFACGSCLHWLAGENDTATGLFAAAALSGLIATASYLLVTQ